MKAKMRRYDKLVRDKITEIIRAKAGRRLELIDYDLETIRELGGKKFEIAYSYRHTIGHTEWLEAALRKV